MKKIFTVISILLILLTSCQQAATPTLEEKQTETQNALDENKNPNNLSKSLIDELCSFLSHLNMDIEKPAKTLKEKFDDIKNGKELVYAECSNSDYYFVSGYFNCFEQHDESFLFCCAEEYTWIKYDNEYDIKKTYCEKNIIISFQINVLTEVINLKNTEKKDYHIEHYQIYNPIFLGENNIANAINFNNSYAIIFPFKDEIYFSNQSHSFSLNSIQIIKKNSNILFLIHCKTKDIKGEIYNVDLNYELGNYYNDIMPFVEKYEHVISDEFGNEDYYLTIDIFKINFL